MLQNPSQGIGLSPFPNKKSSGKMSMRICPSVDSKESACNAGDPVLTPGLGRSPGDGHGNPLQHFCLENSIGKGAWATVHGVAKSQT